MKQLKWFGRHGGVVIMICMIYYLFFWASIPHVLYRPDKPSVSIVDAYWKAVLLVHAVPAFFVWVMIGASAHDDNSGY